MFLQVSVRALQIIDHFKGKTIDITDETIIAEVSGGSDKISAFIELMAPFKVIEMVRSGKWSCSVGCRKRVVMPGSSFGSIFKVVTFGESYGPAIGCVIDGCPPNVDLTEADIQVDLIGVVQAKVRSQHHEKNLIPLRSCPVFLKVRQPVRRLDC